MLYWWQSNVVAVVIHVMMVYSIENEKKVRKRRERSVLSGRFYIQVLQISKVK